MKKFILLFITFFAPILKTEESVQQWFDEYRKSMLFIKKTDAQYSIYQKTLCSILDGIFVDNTQQIVDAVNNFPVRGRNALLNMPFEIHEIQCNASAVKYPNLHQHLQKFDNDFHYYNLAPLCFALLVNKENSIHILHKLGAYINNPLGNEDYPLAIAIKHAPAYVPYFIEHGALVHGLHNQQAPIFVATIKNNIKAVEQLLHAGANINALSEPLELTPMCVAGNHGYYDLVQFFIDHGANVNATDPNGNPPIFWATGNMNSHITHLLLEHGANIRAVNNKGNTVIEWISHSFDDIHAMELLRNGAPYPKTEFHQKMIHEKLESSLTYNSSFYKKFLCALLSDKTQEAIQSITNAEYNDLNNTTMTMRGLTVLHWAVIRGNEEVTQALLDTHKKHGHIGNQKQNNLFQLPFTSHSMVQPVNIDCCDGHGRTPLIWAARLGYKAMYELLIAHGANQFAKDKKGLTAEAYAYKFKNASILGELSNVN